MTDRELAAALDRLARGTGGLVGNEAHGYALRLPWTRTRAETQEQVEVIREAARRLRARLQPEKRQG